MESNILEIKDLQVGFKEKNGFKQILNGVNLEIKKGETLCIVGESGCGKSLTSLSVMGLLPKSSKIKSGEIVFRGQDLTKKSQKELSKIRGNDVSIIFQEPMTSLNPVQTIGKQLIESIRIHQKMSKKAAFEKGMKMLDVVGIPSPQERMNNYPHELSGGMRQRVMIAMALVCEPKLLIADEPTTALDVTIQSQILELINGLKRKLDMSIMMITHDLGVVSEMADRVLVMYAGEVIEYRPVRDLFDQPYHPYTAGLIASLPKLKEEKDELDVIAGTVPDPKNMPSGCRFATRCKFAKKECFHRNPPRISTGNGFVSCWMKTDEWKTMTDEEGKIYGTNSE